MLRTRLALRSIVLATSVVLAGAASDVAAAGPWTKAGGEGLLQLSAYRIGSYDSLYSRRGDDFRVGREVTETTVEVYGEYGVTGDWTVVGTLPFRLQEAGGLVANPDLAPTTIAEGTFSRPGDVVVGVRRKIVAGDYALAGQLDVVLPTGDFDAATGLSTGYDALAFVPSLAAGKGFDRAYVQGSLGFGLRNDDFSNEWHLAFEGGYRAARRLWLVGLVSVLQSFEEGDVVLPAGNLETGLFVNDQEFVAYGVKALIEITERVGVHVTIHGAGDGAAVPKAPLVGAGVSFKW